MKKILIILLIIAGFTSCKVAKQDLVIETQKPISLAFNQQFLNKEVLVLAETNHNGKTYGHSKEYLSIEIDGVYEPNNFYNVKINSISNDKIIGEVI